MVDQEISQHRAAEGSDERCHHRVSQGRAPLSQNRKCERFWTLPLNGLNDRARSSNRICRFLDRGELFACKFNFKDSLESQAVILLARADGAGEFCDATTRATGDQ